MEHRDYFQRQIDQFGKGLANVLSLLMKKGYTTNALDGMEMIDQVLNEHLHLNMQELIDQEEDSFIHFLLEKLKVSPNNLESLVEVILIYAKNTSENQRIYKKALIILQYIQNNSSDYSFERNLKIQEIEALMA